MSKQNNGNRPQPSPEQLLAAANAIKNARDIVCSCGCNIFTEGMKVKQLSKLVTGEANDRIIPIPTAFCIKCHKELNVEEEKVETKAPEIILNLDLKK